MLIATLVLCKQYYLPDDFNVLSIGVLLTISVLLAIVLLQVLISESQKQCMPAGIAVARVPKSVPGILKGFIIYELVYGHVDNMEIELNFTL